MRIAIGFKKQFRETKKKHRHMESTFYAYVSAILKLTENEWNNWTGYSHK